MQSIIIRFYVIVSLDSGHVAISKRIFLGHKQKVGTFLWGDTRESARGRTLCGRASLLFLPVKKKKNGFTNYLEFKKQR